MIPDSTAHMSDSPAPIPKPARRPRLTIRSLMVLVILVALFLAFVVNKSRNRDQVKAAGDRTVAWIKQHFLANSISIEKASYGSVDGYFSCDWEYDGEFTTYHARPILFKVRIHSRSSGPEGQVEISSEGRTITVPLADIEKGRKINLMAEFPAAYR